MKLTQNSTHQSSTAKFQRLAQLAQGSGSTSLGSTQLNQTKLCDSNAEIAHTKFGTNSMGRVDTVTLSMGGEFNGTAGMKKPTYYESISKLKNGSVQHCRAHNKDGVNFFNDLQCVTHQAPIK